MLTKVWAIGTMAVLIGCGGRTATDPSAAGDAQKSSAAVPAGFDSTNAALSSTIPAGTLVRIRLAQSVDTQRNRAGDPFSATLDRPIHVGEKMLVPKGTPFNGHVTASDASGRLKGRATLGVTLDSFELNGKSHKIETSSQTRASAGHKKRNGILIGGGAGLGAALGAMAGGGKGALIGAGAGAAAGTAGAAATGKANVAFPVETPLTFSLKSAVTI
jgi:hypothetical protein